jgi:small subunit ribosomal protein S17
MTKKKQRLKTGRVVSTRMDKTVIVEVSVIKKHPLYHKRYIRSKKYFAHDEKNVCQVGDIVTIKLRLGSAAKKLKVTLEQEPKS